LTLSDEARNYILSEHLCHISCISDKEYQKRVWIDAKGPEEDSFEDTVCDFFIVCDSILNEYHEFNITDNQYVILKKFRNEFRIFSDKHDHPCEFICSPEWEKIMDSAKDVLKAFNYQTQ
jgi:hypothetical protein